VSGKPQVNGVACSAGNVANVPSYSLGLMLLSQGARRYLLHDDISRMALLGLTQELKNNSSSGKSAHPGSYSATTDAVL
jgi:hypothetical protein